MDGSNILLLILPNNKVIEDKTITYHLKNWWGICGVMFSKVWYCGVNMWGSILPTYSIFTIPQVRHLPLLFIQIKHTEII
tara:strand:- start:228 stop:467 length:240 start_codon:yes stop_codon:yes gene_type:complete